MVEREKRERGERQRRETEKRDRGERQGIASQREEGTQAYALILKASQGKKRRVPVSWLIPKSSRSNFANWPNSAGMGPGVYKTQSKHTKIKSRHRTGTISLRNASLCLNIEGKSGKRGMEYR